MMLDASQYINQVLHGKCEDVLATIPSESVDLIVTSPPYADNRKLAGAYQGVPIDGYVDWFKPIGEELFRVLKPRGSFILNIKERAVKGERQVYVLLLILALKEQGWSWVEEYIWHKSNCFPGKWPNRFRDAWERCLHFTKTPQPRGFDMYQENVTVPVGEWAKSRLKNLSATDKTRDESRVGSGMGKRVENWVGRDMVNPDNVLHFATESGNRDHGATFPITLPDWFIRLFTNDPEHIVLDPFLGSGTTALAALDRDRRWIGIEVSDHYCDVAQQAIQKKQQAIQKKQSNQRHVCLPDPMESPSEGVAMDYRHEIHDYLVEKGEREE